MEWNIEGVDRKKKKTYQPRILNLVELTFRSNGEIKTSSDKQKLREFVVSRTALKEMLKEVL